MTVQGLLAKPTQEQRIDATHMTYILRVQYPQEVKRYDSANKRRFFHYTRLIKWNLTPLVTLRVTYGYQLDHRGKRVLFQNEGDYTNKHDFNMALEAFTE